MAEQMEIGIGEKVSRQWLRDRAGKFYSNETGTFCDLPTQTFKMLESDTAKSLAGTDEWKRIE